MVKQVRCQGRLYGVVYEYTWGGGHSGTTFKGVADWEYRMSVPAVMLDDTTPEGAQCLEKIKNYYGIDTARATVIDIDAESSPAATR